MLDRLTFDTERHIYRVDNSPVPSVSAVLKAAGFGSNLAAVPVAILEAARERGIAVHAYCESLDRDEVPMFPEKLQPYLTAYMQFRADVRFRVIETERALFHPEYLYAGRPDSVGWVNDQRSLVDRKVVAEIDHPYVGAQLGAYVAARNALFPEERVDAVYSLHLKKDGHYKLEGYDPEACWRMFAAAYELYKRKRIFQKGSRWTAKTS